MANDTLKHFYAKNASFLFRMKIGIVEYKDDQFIRDVISKLGEFEIEFVFFREQSAPVGSDYRVIVDRLGFMDPYLRELMKNLALSGTYIINNPFSSAEIDKISNTKHFDSLGISHPKTIVLPRINELYDFNELVGEPDWNRICEEISFPCILKPFDGYAWDNVYRVNSLDELKNLYDAMKFRHILLVQELIRYVDYYRVFCINKRDVLLVKWNPKPFDMGESIYTDLKQIEDLKDSIIEKTIKLNSSIDLDFNAVEWCITEDRRAFIIDAFNDTPEIVRGKIPEPYYWWIVDKFADCIREKFHSNEKNRTIFPLP